MVKGFLKSKNEHTHIKMKITTSSDYTIAFLDILCYKNKSNKYFDFSTPLTVMLGTKNF